MVRVGAGGWRGRELEFRTCSTEPLWLFGVGSQLSGGREGSALTAWLGVGVGETSELAAAGRAKPGSYGQGPASTRLVPAGPRALQALGVKVRLWAGLGVGERRVVSSPLPAPLSQSIPALPPCLQQGWC